MRNAIAAGHPPTNNRRSEHRVLQKARVIVIATDEGRYPLTLGNLSSRGASGRCGRVIPAGSRVRLTFEAGREAAGQVRWSRGMLLGIQFDSPLPMDLLTRSAAITRDRARRIPVNRPAMLLGDCPRPVMIRNISETGLLIQAPFTLEPGQNVAVQCGELALSGQVRWSRQGRSGVQLAAPLSIEAFDRATRIG